MTALRELDDKIAKLRQLRADLAAKIQGVQEEINALDAQRRRLERQDRQAEAEREKGQRREKRAAREAKGLTPAQIRRIVESPLQKKFWISMLSDYDRQGPGIAWHRRVRDLGSMDLPPALLDGLIQKGYLVPERGQHGTFYKLTPKGAERGRAIVAHLAVDR